MHLAQRMGEIEPFHVMELMARAKALEAEGRSIIHMEVGEPDFPTPAPIVEAGLRFVESGRVFYTQAQGLPELREAIAHFYRHRHGVAVDPTRIVITAGASAALLLALALLVDPDDEVLLTDPGYPCNPNFARLLGAVPKRIPVGPESGYQPQPEQVANAWGERTRALLVASPSNPTGTLLSETALLGLWREVAARAGQLIVDEIYHGLTYERSACSAVSLSDDIFVINSFSKYFGMTGWRLGWLVVPDACVRDAEKLAQNLYISAPAPAQYAALAAFQPDTLAILESRRQEYRRRRDLLLPALKSMGFSIPAEPEGAFYIYAGLGELADDSFDFCYRLLEHAGVAATPGRDFGSHAPERHVRFAYTIAEEKLAEGIRRLRNFLSG